MKNIKILALPLLISSLFAQQNTAIQSSQIAQNTPPSVYPANAGAAVQQNIQVAQQQNAQLMPAAQLKDFGASVFANESGKLVKRDLSTDSLKKAAVIFFGDWCPNCHKFLKDSSGYLNSLGASGVRLILVHVPAADKLRNWQDPTVQEYDGVKQIVESFGINLSSNVEIVLLGERTVLSKTGITGLPVFIAVKNSKEFRREVGTKGAADLQDNAVKAQLMNTWNAGEENKPAKTAYKMRAKDKSKVETIKINKIRTESHPKLTKEKMIQAKTATAMLNEYWLGSYNQSWRTMRNNSSSKVDLNLKK